MSEKGLIRTGKFFDISRGGLWGTMGGIVFAATEIFFYGGIDSPLVPLTERLFSYLLPFLVLYGGLGAISGCFLGIVFYMFLKEKPDALDTFLFSAILTLIPLLYAGMWINEVWLPDFLSIKSLLVNFVLINLSCLLFLITYFLFNKIGSEGMMTPLFFIVVIFMELVLVGSKYLSENSFPQPAAYKYILNDLMVLSCLTFLVATASYAVWLLVNRSLIGLRKGIVIVGILTLLSTSWLVMELYYNQTSTFQGKGVPWKGAPNVIIIVLDTARADHLSAYGYHRETTPTIDRIAKEGVLFENAVSTSSGTVISHFDLITSRYDVGPITLDENLETLAEILKSQGYDTYGVVANPIIGRGSGFEQGFDIFVDKPDPALFLLDMFAFKVLDKFFFMDIFDRLFNHDCRKAREVNQNVFKLLERNHSRPFFLFLNYLDPHDPYIPPPGYKGRYISHDVDETIRYLGRFGKNKKIKSYSEVIRDFIPTMTPRDWENVKGLYDEEIFYMDAQIGKLITRLRDMNILDNSILFITADHGELFGEHDLAFHYVGLTEQEIRIPLIMRYPKYFSPYRKVDHQVQLIDIMPTILEIIGINAPKGIEGMSLMSLVNSDSVPDRDKRKAYSMLFKNIDPKFPRTTGRGNLVSIRTNERKYVWSSMGKDEFYDLTTDPQGVHNILNPDVESAFAFRKELLDWQKQYTRLSFYRPPKLDKSAEEKLRALGYIQ